ncbi:hypothetical protein C8Q80DRAFT_390491 [Daedaleopsis nitida]|nr:hypothetical protein C8Q80DRAFT_390491 [Daedaleopsis nitida]
MSSSAQHPTLFSSTEALSPSRMDESWWTDYIHVDRLESDSGSNSQDGDGYLPWDYFSPSLDLQPESLPLTPPSGSFDGSLVPASTAISSLCHSMLEQLVIAPHRTTPYLDVTPDSLLSLCNSENSPSSFLAPPSAHLEPVMLPIPRCPSALSEASSSSSSSSSTFSSTLSSPCSSRPVTPASPYLTPARTSASRRGKPRKSSSAARHASARKSLLPLRNNQRARNVQIDIREENIKPLVRRGQDHPSGSYCRVCTKKIGRHLDLGRHLRTHMNQKFACVGVTVEEANRIRIPPEQRINSFILYKNEMVGGCWRTFSREDTFKRGT